DRGNAGGNMAEYRFCRVEDEGRIRVVTINRPEVLNALHSEAHWEFDGIWNEFAADPELWVGIITGDGERAISAGNDLKGQAASRRRRRERGLRLARAQGRADRRQQRPPPAADDRPEGGARHDPDRKARLGGGR